MDHQRFDALARRFAAPRSRRSFLRAAASAAAAGLLARLPAARPAAAAGCRIDADCADGNACTTDTCRKRVCQHLPIAVVCTALDQCHVAGTCDPSTGRCTNPPKPDGTACDDGNPCTRADTCQAGACVGGNPVVCTASDQCHVAGTCDPATGACSNPTAPDGTGCTDGNACTTGDTCRGGVCTGGATVSCSASDQCHVAGTCDPATGQCSNPNAPDGTPCSDTNACTDTCQGGACTPGTTVICAPPDQCHAAGACNPATGGCAYAPKANGTACDDGNRCTTGETCQGGVCTGGAAKVCAALDQCHAAGACDPATGLCSNPPKANGTACTDGNACTRTDTCQAGACVGGNPVVCTASDQCHVAGNCNPADGTCSNPFAGNGLPCGAPGQTCEGGACVTEPPCGDGTCSNSETCATCPQDCGECPPACGDGVCDECESCATCPDDCGACPTPCTTDADCVPEPGCHPNSCIDRAYAPASTCFGGCDAGCSGLLDCGQGVCLCQEGLCVGFWGD